MKKIFTNITLIFLSFFVVMTSVNAGCSLYASKGESTCITQSEDGFKCKWDNNKKGGSRCYKSNELTEEEKTTITSCSQLKNSDSCSSTTINGTKCIWRQNACYGGTTTSESSNTSTNSQGSNTSANSQSSSRGAVRSTTTTSQTSGSTTSEKYGMCSNEDSLKALKIIGQVIYIAKILVPLIIIITGVAALANAVIADDEKEIKTAVYSIIKKFCVGVFVFFIPTIVFAILDFSVTTYNGSDFSACKECLENKDSCLSSSAITCNDGSLLGSVSDEGSTAYYLQIVLDYMKYAGIVICIALTVIDIIKGLTTDNKGLSQDIAKTFFKRMIYASILFFLPSIVNIILELIGAVGTCGIS